MKVKVEACWDGKARYYRLTMPGGARERINREVWDRKAASEALNLLENVYHLPRRSVRFNVH